MTRGLWIALVLSGCIGARSDQLPDQGACASGLTACQDLCVDLQSDAQNCGACGNACSNGQVCSAGTCVTPPPIVVKCDTGLRLCHGKCISVQADDKNCGDCGKTCDSGSSCMNGACVDHCSPLTSCDVGGTLICADLTSDAANCGACGFRCPTQSTCSGSSCVCSNNLTACPSGMPARCVNLQTSLSDCGVCDNACPTGGLCTSGTCSCPANKPNICSNTCVDLAGDVMNCGACGTVCDTSNGKACVDGNCKCPGVTPMVCGNQCADLAFDANNCGTCGHTCSGGTPYCTGGSCTGAVVSCSALKALVPDAPSGTYWVTGGGQTAFLAYCDMTTVGSDGVAGGWTVCYNHYVTNAEEMDRPLASMMTTSWVGALGMSGIPASNVDFGTNCTGLMHALQPQTVRFTAKDGQYWVQFNSPPDAFYDFFSPKPSSMTTGTVNVQTHGSGATTYTRKFCVHDCPTFAANADGINQIANATNSGTCFEKNSKNLDSNHHWNIFPTCSGTYTEGPNQGAGGEQGVNPRTGPGVPWGYATVMFRDTCFTSCNGACVNQLTDVNNCGTCGHVCACGQACVSGSCQTPTLTSQLAAHLSFDEGSGTTAADDSGNMNNGTLASASWASGILSSAVSLDGTSNYVNVPSSASLQNQTITVSGWFNLNTLTFAAPSARPCIAVKGPDASQALDWALCILDSSTHPLYVLTNIGGSWAATNGVTRLGTSQWMHAAFTYDGSTVKLYLNGALEAQRAVSGQLQTSTNPMRIGAYAPSSASDKHFFPGKIDDMRVWSRALSGSEIAALYQMTCAPGVQACTSARANTLRDPNNCGSCGNVCACGQGCNAGSCAALDTTGLAGYWKFDDGAGTTLADSSGAGKNGTLTNSPPWTVGYSGGALQFNGTTQLVTVPNLDLNTWTFAAWVRRNGFSTSTDQCIFCAVGNNGWGVGFHTDNTFFETKVGVNGFYSTKTVSDTTSFHHVAVTFGGSQVCFYLDGVFDRCQTDNDTFSSTGNYGFGARSSNNSAFPGVIDEARVYNRVLSATEIAALWGSTCAGLRPAVCSSARVDEGRDPANCGSCAQACSGATPACVGGGCGSALASGMLGLWNLNESAAGTAPGGSDFKDDSGLLDQGTHVGTVTYGAAGKIGNAVSLDGATAYIGLGGSTTLQPTRAMTVAAWIKPSTTQLTYPQVITAGDSTGQTGFNLYLYNPMAEGEASFIVREGTAAWGSCWARGTSNVRDNAWHHLVGVYTGSTISLYVDGVQQATSACQNVAVNYGTNPVAQIGNKLSNNGTLWNGLIDQAVIWNRALTGAEITQLYGGGSGIPLP